MKCRRLVTGRREDEVTEIAWQKYRGFREWAINSGYSVGMTLSKTDDVVGFSPSNCKWIQRHKESSTTLYRAWSGMRQRCFNSKCAFFHRYGGRGITVCDEWMVYENFRDWSLSNGFKKGLSLDRVNVDDGYNPKNCEWVTKSENTKRIGSMRDKTIKELRAQNERLSQRVNELEIQVATLEGHIAIGDLIADPTYGGTTE